MASSSSSSSSCSEERSAKRVKRRHITKAEIPYKPILEFGEVKWTNDAEFINLHTDLHSEDHTIEIMSTDSSATHLLKILFRSYDNVDEEEVGE